MLTGHAPSAILQGGTPAMPELEGPHRGKLQRLEDLCQQMLAERRLIIASNRGPLEFSIQDDGSLLSRRGGGGRVSPLHPRAPAPLLWCPQQYRRPPPPPPTTGRAACGAWESGYIPVNEAIADAIAAE